MEKQPSFGEVEHDSLDQLSTSEQTDLVELSDEDLEGVTGGFLPLLAVAVVGVGGPAALLGTAIAVSKKRR